MSNSIEDECIEWDGLLTEKKYGRRYLSGKMKRAHRVVYEETHGPILPGMIVMHRCDNPPCILPEHLTVGTVAENNRDMARKGRCRNQHSK